MTTTKKNQIEIVDDNLKRENRIMRVVIVIGVVIVIVIVMGVVIGVVNPVKSSQIASNRVEWFLLGRLIRFLFFSFAISSQ